MALLIQSISIEMAANEKSNLKWIHCELIKEKIRYSNFRATKHFLFQCQITIIINRRIGGKREKYYPRKSQRNFLKGKNKKKIIIITFCPFPGLPFTQLQHSLAFSYLLKFWQHKTTHSTRHIRMPWAGTLPWQRRDLPARAASLFFTLTVGTSLFVVRYYCLYRHKQLNICTNITHTKAKTEIIFL